MPRRRPAAGLIPARAAPRRPAHRHPARRRPHLPRARLRRDRRCATSRTRPTSRPPTSTTTSRGKDEILFFCQDRSLDLHAGALGRRGPAAAGVRGDRLQHVLTAHVRTPSSTKSKARSAHVAVDALSDPLTPPHRRQARSVRARPAPPGRRRRRSAASSSPATSAVADARDARRAQLDRHVVPARRRTHGRRRRRDDRRLPRSRARPERRQPEQRGGR